MPLLSRCLAGLLACLLVATATAHGGDRADIRQARPQSVRLAEDLTRELLDTRNLQATSPRAQQPRRRADVLSIARERRELLRLLLDTDPNSILRLAVPAGIRAAFPVEAQRVIEREVEAEGVLQVIHVDMPGKEVDHYWYFLKTAQGTRPLHFAKRPTRLLTDSRIRVKGIGLDADIVLASGGSGSVTTLAAALPNTLGVQTTLVIPVNFSDGPATPPYTKAQIQQVVLGDTSAWDWENSYQQTSLSGVVTNWFTITEASTACDYQAISSKADAAATAAGHVLSNYRRKVYVFPPNSCPWWGLGTIGGNPSRSWITTKYGFTLSGVAHELGHNFGLYHSHSLDCGTNVVTQDDAGCTSTEYGDVLDVMGGSPNNAAAHFNAFQKEYLGWLGAGVSPPLTTIQAGAGQYSIGNIEAARSSTPRALKIGNTRNSCNIAPSQWYYVEKREAVGYDAFIGNYATTIPNSVVIRRVNEGDPDSSYLLDMSPATSTWHDIGLVNGASYTDPVTGLVIQPVAVGAGYANVNVSYAAASCANKPEVKLGPAGTAWRVPGEAASYTATVVNTDSCGCPATTFNVTPTLPSGWSGNGGATSALAPGASAQVQVGITVGAGATPGFYSVPVDATAQNDAGKTAVAKAEISVVLPTALTSGVVVTPISAAKDAGLVYSLQVPPGKTSLTFNTYGGSADADLYVRLGAVPSLTQYGCISGGPATTENCTIQNPQAGTWYVMVHAYTAISGVSLLGQYAPADPVLPALSIADVAMTEGQAGTTQANFTLSLSHVSATAVTVDVATVPGTAAPGGDFTAKATAGFTIPAGQASANFQVPVHGDNQVEGNEGFSVHLSNAANATIADGQALGRINNDDLATLSIADVAIVEGAAGTTSTATFVLRLSAPMPSPVYYDIGTGNGSALGGSDFVARQLAGRFIDAGRTTQAFEVAIIGDGNVEPNETFNVSVSNVSGATVADGAAVGSIGNDDGATVAPALAPTTVKAPTSLRKPRKERSRVR